MMSRCIVLTGAWGGGKSTLLRELEADPRFAGRFLRLPEAAPLVRQMGFDVQATRFEQHVLTMQHALEDAADQMGAAEHERVVLSHRGALDALSFWRFQGGERQEFFDLCDTSPEAELGRYDAVILLRSTAGDAPVLYENYRRDHTRPPAEVALRLEAALETSWAAHPRFFAIGNQGICWERKSALARAVLEARLPMPEPVRIETANASLAAITYPSTQDYQLGQSGEFLPSPGALRRLDELEQVLPAGQWDSLIDIGCAKGMFLIWAVQHLGLRRTVGLDVAADMVQACRMSVEASRAPATILHGSPQALRPLLAPADLVLVLHCYHYLYFGSPLGIPALPSHDLWFDLFASLTANCLVFANPLFMTADQVEEHRRSGISEAAISAYCPEMIMASASRHFWLQEFDLGGGRPYILMKKRI